MKMTDVTRMLLGCVIGRCGICNTASSLCPCQKHPRSVHAAAAMGLVFFVFAFLQASQVLGENASAPTGSQATATSPSPDVMAPMTDIHDILPPVPVGLDASWLWIGLIAIGAVMLAALAWWLWKKVKKSRSVETIVPEKPPEMVARQALDQLSDVRGMDGKTFYFRLSAILRRYVFGRFGVGATEMTTEEFVPCIDHLSIDTELARELKRLCRAMDPVKFGGQAIAEKQMEADLFFAREFVRKTTQRFPMEKDNIDIEPRATTTQENTNSNKQIPNLK
jgi:hypothetical protein